MADTIAGPTIVIGGDARPALGAIEDVSEALDKLGGIAKEAFAFIGVGLGINELKNLVGASQKLATELSKLGGETGATVTGLQAVRHAADLGGVSLDGFGDTIRKVSEAMIQLEKGGVVADAFSKLGIAAEDIVGLDIDKQFAVIANAVANTTLSTKDLTDALKEIGLEGMIALLRRGGEQFANARDEVIKLGAALSDVDAAKIRNASEEWDRFGKSASLAMTAVGNQITKDLSPLLSGLLKDMNDIGAIDFMGKSVGLSVFSLIGAFSLLADGVHKARQAMEATGRLADSLLGNPPKPSELDAMFPSERIKEWLKTVRESADAAANVTTDSDRKQLDSKTRTTDAIIAEEDRKLIAQQEAAAKSLDSLMKTLLTSEDFETASYARRLEQLVAFREQGLLTQDQFNALAERNNQIHVDKINEAQSRAFLQSQQLWSGYATQINNLLSSVTSAIGTQGKKQFAITKALALASAVVKGYESIVSAYAAGSRIGGPPVGAAFAAIAAASTAAQIAALRNTNENSSGGGSASSSAGGDVAVSAQASQTLIVEGLDPNAIMSGASMRQLAERMIAFQADGGQILLAPVRS